MARRLLGARPVASPDWERTRKRSRWLSQRNCSYSPTVSSTPLSIASKRITCSHPQSPSSEARSSEKKQENCQYEIDDQGRAGLRKALHAGHEQVSENDHVPSREDQNRQRGFAGRLLFSGRHERDIGKSQRALAIEKSELGIRQCALRDLLEYTRRKHEHHAEEREVDGSDVQRDLQFSRHRSLLGFV